MTTQVAAFHRRSIEEREAFWAEQAANIDWFAKPEKILDFSNPPFARWYVGGKTNLCHNAVDRHLASRADQPALVYISTETQQEKTYSYKALHQEVQAMASILKSLGVKRGDRVLIYMPMIAEAIFSMLACARIGAIHSVVFGGFAAPSLAARIDDAQPVVMISADAGMRNGKEVPYKHLVDEACRLAEKPPAKVLLVDRGLAPMTNVQGRDVDYAALRKEHLSA
ncbi:MAG: AMP-binding protein, partial [Betaproteobacteria bacterium]|nr:AMP-binding protein [Betaproteobacteria bacterium]